MPRFVVQEHTRQEQVHWDLMLEKGNCLATWQVPARVGDWPKGAISCRKLADHRLRYLTYEGPIGGGRGDVQIVESGTYEELEMGEDCWQDIVKGQIIRGRLELKHRAEDRWELEFQGE